MRDSHLWEGRGESRIGQKKKLNCSAGLTSPPRGVLSMSDPSKSSILAWNGWAFIPTMWSVIGYGPGRNR